MLFSGGCACQKLDLIVAGMRRLVMRRRLCAVDDSQRFRVPAACVKHIKRPVVQRRGCISGSQQPPEALRIPCGLRRRGDGIRVITGLLSRGSQVRVLPGAPAFARVPRQDGRLTRGVAERRVGLHERAEYAHRRRPHRQAPPEDRGRPAHPAAPPDDARDRLQVHRVMA